jgi:hypothetical protein
VAPGFFAAWRDQRRLRRSAALYVQSLLEEPDASDVAWLSDVATRGDVDRARWELRYARRASGLLSAERDALDDRTASAVARELAEGWSRDRTSRRGCARRPNSSSTRGCGLLGQALTARSSPEPTGTRLGKALLVAAGLGAPPGDAVERAASIVVGYLEQANVALQREFGTATLPENLPPSALQPRSGAASRR